VAPGKQRHQDLFDYRFLPDDPLPDLGAQPRSRGEKVLARRHMRFR
jgi:hypothetical protein